MSLADQKLKELGTRLRGERLQRNETQAIFAARLGISVPTLYKMEAGDPTVLVGHWINALEVLDRVQEIDGLLTKKDLFELYEATAPTARKRASRRQK
uniref:XRE family transcriptional regulator n=1 Tax=Geobacter sp. (strain M21) TaxID=443144 RepID=C6DYH8_GEOSM